VYVLQAIGIVLAASGNHPVSLNTTALSEKNALTSSPSLSGKNNLQLPEHTNAKPIFRTISHDRE